MNYINNKNLIKNNTVNLTDIIFILSNFALIAILIDSLLVVTQIFDYSHSNVFVTWECLVVSLMCLIAIWTNRVTPKLGLSVVLLIYTIMTQFGCNTIYYLLPKYYPIKFSSPRLIKFLYSEKYVEGVLVGVIAIICYTLVLNITSILKIKKSRSYKIENSNKSELERNIVIYIGYVLLTLVIIYFGYLFATGRLAINTTYKNFRETIIGNTYLVILLMYSMGICFIVSCGEKKQIIKGLILFSVVACIFFLTGNRGEVFFPLLACIGVWYYRGNKLNKISIFIILILVFVVIPFVSTARGNGVINGFDNMYISFTEPLVEMGMQLRLTIYTMEQFITHSRELLLGFSYYNPWLNIISKLFFIPKLPTPWEYDINNVFPAMGYSQIAESYSNFGLIGVIIFHVVIAYFMASMETKKLSFLNTAYFSSIVSILIELTRNRFSLFPVMFCFVTVVYLITNLIINYNYKKICMTIKT